MTGLSRTSDDLDPRQRRILYRAWHRGTREMDLVIGRFAESEIAAMDEKDLDAFEALMEVPERDLFAWLSGRVAAPEAFAGGVLQRLIAFHHMPRQH